MICEMIAERILDSLWPDELETTAGLYHRLGRSRTPASKRVSGGGDLLRPDLHARGIAEGVYCRNNNFAGSAVDGADGPERDAGGDRLSLRLSISLARSRCQVLRLLRRRTGVGGRQGRAIAATQSKPERPIWRGGTAR